MLTLAPYLWSGGKMLLEFNPYLFWIALFLGLIVVGSIVAKLAWLFPVGRFGFRYFSYVMTAIILIGSTVMFAMWLSIVHQVPEQREFDSEAKAEADYQVWKLDLQHLMAGQRNVPETAPMGSWRCWWHGLPKDEVASEILQKRLPDGTAWAGCELLAYEKTDAGYALTYAVHIKSVEDAGAVPVVPESVKERPLRAFLIYADDLPSGLLFNSVHAPVVLAAGETTAFIWHVRLARKERGYWMFRDTEPLPLERRSLFEGRFIRESGTPPVALLRNAGYLARAPDRAKQALAELDQKLKEIDGACANYVPTIAAHPVQGTNQQAPDWHLNGQANVGGTAINVDFRKVYEMFGAAARQKKEAEAEAENAAEARSEGRQQMKAYRTQLWHELEEQLRHAAMEHDALFGYGSSAAK